MMSSQHYLPTIYALNDAFPLAVCSGNNLPDGTPASPDDGKYANSCTIKVCVSSPYSLFILFSGSCFLSMVRSEIPVSTQEDFIALVPKIFGHTSGRYQNIRIWLTNGSKSTHWTRRVRDWRMSLVRTAKLADFPVRKKGLMAICNAAFAEKPLTPRYIPVELSTPLFRLTGKKTAIVVGRSN